VGVAGWPVTGRRRGSFSTLLRRPVLRAYNGFVLATTRTQNVSEYMLVLALCLVLTIVIGYDRLKFSQIYTPLQMKSWVRHWRDYLHTTSRLTISDRILQFWLLVLYSSYSYYGRPMGFTNISDLHLGDPA